MTTRTVRTLSVIACLAVCASGASVGAQGGVPRQLQEARAHMAAGRFAQADSILESFVQQAPQNAQVWVALGNARRNLARVDDAALAFRQAMKLGAVPQAAPALFLLYATAKRLDDAAHLLDTLRQFNVPDFSGLVLSPGIENLRNDKRFAMLFPDSAVFTKPFVENVRIIHEWRGEAKGDEFGWIARAIGDVDGDHVSDVVVSATMNPPFGSGAGKLYVYSGKSGKLLWKKQGAARASLGMGVEAAGDVNHDGIPDVVAGAPGLNSLLVYSGRDGAELLQLRGDSTDIDLGMRASGIGDIDGDGYADVIGGAPSAMFNGAAVGRVHIFSGKDGRRLLSLHGQRAGDAFGSAVAGGGGLFVVGAASAGASGRGQAYIYRRLDSVPAFIKDADETGTQFAGMFASILGDVDKDGTVDVFVSDFANSAKGPATGRTYVYSGKTGATLHVLTGEGGAFGTSSSQVGDVNGDGAADVLVGSWQWKNPAWSGGRVQLFSGKDGQLLRTITGRVPGETLGFDAVGVGDVDGDGVVDYLITSAYSLVNGARSGRVFIVSGKMPK